MDQIPIFYPGDMGEREWKGGEREGGGRSRVNLLYNGKTFPEDSRHKIKLFPPFTLGTTDTTKNWGIDGEMK